jgi:hypothetical protein
MPEVDITVNCQISGQNADFEYDNENKLSQFISDLQEMAMAWSTGKPPESAGISIDGQPGNNYNDHVSSTLLDLGVSGGEVIIIMQDITQAS